MSFINKTNILIKKNNNDLYYFDLDKDIVFTKISNKTNTLISKKLFDDYCTWLFDILFEVEKETNMEGYTKAQRRVFGYISEILLNVWVLHNKLKVKYMDVINTETSIKYRITHRN